MRFAIGQKYESKKHPHKIAEVLQLDDEGRKAWVDVRDADGALLDSAWVVYSQFSENWTLIWAQ